MTRSIRKRTIVRLSVTIVLAVVLAFVLASVQSATLFVWVKAFHVIAIISWMAGMLYLPRLFIYHCNAEQGSPQSETFKLMEQRLLRVILTPAMIASWVLGLWLAYSIYPFDGYWLWIKIAAVVGLTWIHGHYAAAVRRFGEDRNAKSAGYWRVMNEVPTVLMIVIVVMVIVKPV